MKSALTALTLTAAAALLTFDALATTSTDRHRTRDTSSRNEILRGIYNEPLGSASDPDTTLGGSFNNPWTGGGSSDPQWREFAAGPGAPGLGSGTQR